jgi:F-type H+-transporting ATPase subunit gamma
MASLRQIRRKIGSVKGTQRIMKAMKLISVVRLQRAQGILQAYRPYSNTFGEIVRNLALRCDPQWHPLLRRPEENKRLRLVFMTSDRGLCGSFNSNLIRKIETYLVTDAKAYEQVTFTLIGKRGRDHFGRRNAQAERSYTGVNERNFSDISTEIADALIKGFVKGECDEVILVFNYFRSALSQIITFERLLPMGPANTNSDSNTVDYLYEPGRTEVLKYVLPKYVEVHVERAILESITSEHAARMAAMENATRNADAVIRRLTLLFNKTRQALITKELMDIVNGTEALRKGGID